MKYKFLNTIRDGSSIFWMMVYPLLMLSMFSLSFGNIMNADAVSVKVGVDAGNPMMAVYRSISILEVIEVAEEDADSALRGGDIRAYIKNDGNMIVKSGGFNQTIVKTVLDQVKQMSSLAISAQSYDFEREYTHNTNETAGTDNFLVIFYTLFGMVGLQAAYGAVEDITRIQANLGFLGQRVEIAPTKKWRQLLGGAAVTFVFTFAALLLTVGVAVFVFRLELIQRPIESFVMLTLITVLGIALGTFVGLSSRAGVGAKTGLLVGITLMFSAMGGMMGVDLRNLLMVHAPWILRLNPISAFSETMLRINVTGDSSFFAPTVLILCVEIVIMGVLSLLFLRRRQYASL